jgi:hypothetical protein
MHAAVATLQKGARQLQLSGELERSDYSGIVTQLRQVAEGLTALERRTGKQKAVSVNYTEMLHAAIATASTSVGQDETGGGMPVPDGIMVEGPAHDLHDLLSSLVEYARTVGGDPIELRAQILHQVLHKGGDDNGVCATELVIQSPDLPDFLRRKLWDAARVRRGQVSVISELECCRVGFTLPVERRLAAVG